MRNPHFRQTQRNAQEMYESIGYEVCCTSAIEKKGLGFITKRITDKTTLVAGQSGVGKSSLVNALDIGVSLRTHEISDYTGKGQHTTTFAEMFEIIKALSEYLFLQE